ncbi:signal transduction histidine kinase [Bradyrhizobium sp. LB8.2]|uniref:sensor histidine kinase n=1 Tax=unclassified Bradyrhizobium TaxID=2631580 RepID=UPI001FFB861B|nr:HAMP domain-containing histidine kinase [Bradyrhizobium sp. 197]
MRLPEFARTRTFRWTLLRGIVVAAGAFAICVGLMIGFIYWPNSTYVIDSVDRLITDRADTFSALPSEQRLQALQWHIDQDPRRVKLVALFDPHGNRIMGNIESLPHGLELGARPRETSIVRIDALGREKESVRATARRLADGQILVVGRNVDEVAQMGNSVERVLAWGIIPALCLGLAVGAYLSIRTQRRIDEVNQLVQRIVAGELRERLPVQGTNAPFDELATLINGMLDEIEVLLRSVAGVGDDIAHDLRTPLTNVRMTLERGRHNATKFDQLQASVDQAIMGLDQSLTMITALLRIAEIEHSRRLVGFRDVELAELVRDVAELYEPIAKDKGVALTVEAKEEIVTRGDRDLLFEAVANLVDNAVKFTPECGQIELKLSLTEDGGTVRVSDTGRGIPASERDLVTRRFYRSDKSRGEPGLGLGLSLVTAIVKLHGFRFTLSPAPGGPGCIAQIAF